MKRYLVLVACVILLACLGTNQAWSAFVGPLRRDYALSAFQTQLVFNTATFFFCLMIIFGGRLHDHFGPRRVAAAGGLIVGSAWFLAAAQGASFPMLWLGIGVLGGTGSGVVYLCPLATAVKWFPRHRGLISGLMAAGFAGGPVLLSTLAETLLSRGWSVLEIFRLVGTVYTPVILAMGLLLALPPGQPGRAEVKAFRRRTLLRDRRFWTLFVGMFCGTLPFLTVMGSVKPIGLNFGIGEAAVFAISVMAVGNAAGRVFWGFLVDRVGLRRAMLASQSIMIASMLCLVLLGPHHPAFFLAAAFGVGFCYGSNFAIYPSASAHLYGAHVLGSVYPLVMAAQAISSAAPTVNGLLFDATGSYMPGLSVATSFAVLGLVASTILSRPTAHVGRSAPA